jgi:two-component system, cell cycle response regulator
MPGTGPADAASAAERLRGAIEQITDPAAANALPRLSISIGVACSGGRELPAETLLSEADHALYAAKHGGRNRVEMA